MPPALFIDTESSSGIGASLLPQSSASSLRSVFLTASIAWSVFTVIVSTWLGIWTLASSIFPGILSLVFAGLVAAQAAIAYLRMKQTLRRFVRFGLTSSAFARISPRLMIAWIVVSVAQVGCYIAALVLYIDLASSSDEQLVHVGRIGVVWFSIIGVFMLSLMVGFILVSRVSPWLSSWFIRMPPQTPQLVIPEMD